MATIVKTKSGFWKAIFRITGNPIVTKTFQIKRDATDWARATEDENKGVSLIQTSWEWLVAAIVLTVGQSWYNTRKLIKKV